LFHFLVNSDYFVNLFVLLTLFLKILFMIPLTLEEKEIKAWAGKAFKEPWFDLVQKCAKISRGEKLDDIWYHPFFIDIFIDVRFVYKIMKAIKISDFVNGNLFTIILSKKEDRVIWACFEKQKDGVFTEAIVLNPEEKWADKVAELLFIDNLQGAYEYVSSWVKRNELGDSVGAIKVANIMFFKAIKDAWEKSYEGKNLPLFFMLFLDAVKKIIEKRWLRFYPNVNLYKMIKISYPLLKELSYVTYPLSKILSAKPVNDVLVAYNSFVVPLKVSI